MPVSKFTIQPQITQTFTVRLKVGPRGVAGTGDMTKAVYDPTTVAGDAFDMDNMVEGTNLILSAGERTKLSNTSNTNTGDQTLPVKATGAELDTGTDDAKFATPKAIKDSKNVPSVAPGTVGNVMTSDGTDWTSAASSGGGSVDETLWLIGY